GPGLVPAVQPRKTGRGLRTRTACADLRGSDRDVVRGAGAPLPSTRSVSEGGTLPSLTLRVDTRSVSDPVDPRTQSASQRFPVLFFNSGLTPRSAPSGRPAACRRRR